eukprot:5121590-Pleurochrysis_carterae.AAC.2
MTRREEEHRQRMSVSSWQASYGNPKYAMGITSRISGNMKILKGSVTSHDIWPMLDPASQGALVYIATEWSISISHYEYPFRPPYTTPQHGEDGMDISECWRLFTFAFNGVRSRVPCSCTWRAKSEIIHPLSIIPPMRPVSADEFTPSMAYVAMDACQGPIAATFASHGSMYFSRGRQPVYIVGVWPRTSFWRYVLGIRWVQADRSAPGMAYLAVNASHGLHAALKYPLRNLHPVPELLLYPRLTTGIIMANITDLVESNELAATIPDSHLKIFRATPIDVDKRTLSEEKRQFLSTL